MVRTHGSRSGVLAKRQSSAPRPLDPLHIGMGRHKKTPRVIPRGISLRLATYLSVYECPWSCGTVIVTTIVALFPALSVAL